MIHLDEGVYEGNYLKDFKEGEGKFIYKNGTIFDGNWKAGKKEGKGKLTVPEEGVWEGSWTNDRRHGIFILKNNNKQIKTETWMDDSIAHESRYEVVGSCYIKEAPESLEGVKI